MDPYGADEVLESSLAYFGTVWNSTDIVTVSFPIMYALASLALSVTSVRVSDTTIKKAQQDFAQLQESLTIVERKIKSREDKENLVVLGMASSILGSLIGRNATGSDVYKTHIRMLSDTCANQRCQIALLSLYTDVTETPSQSDGILESFRISTHTNPYEMQDFIKELHQAVTVASTAFIAYELVQYGEVGIDRVEKLLEPLIAKLSDVSEKWTAYAREKWSSDALATLKAETKDVVDYGDSSMRLRRMVDVMSKKYGYAEWYCVSYDLLELNWEWNEASYNQLSTMADAKERIICFYLEKWVKDVTVYSDSEKESVTEWMQHPVEKIGDFVAKDSAELKSQTTCGKDEIDTIKNTENQEDLVSVLENIKAQCVAFLLEKAFMFSFPTAKLFGTLIYAEGNHVHWAYSYLDQNAVKRDFCVKPGDRYNYCVFVLHIRKHPILSANTQKKKPPPSVQSTHVKTMISKDDVDQFDEYRKPELPSGIDFVLMTTLLSGIIGLIVLAIVLITGLCIVVYVAYKRLQSCGPNSTRIRHMNAHEVKAHEVSALEVCENKGKSKKSEKSILKPL